jgi:antibiotic biosynthesis monooxygenase (ABM) superfamily enzyme
MLLIFLNKLGLLGAALAFTLKAIFDNILLFWFSSRLIPSNSVLNYNKINLAIGISLIILSFIISTILHSLIMKIIILIIGNIIFIVLAYIFILDNYERKIIYNIFFRLIIL